MPTNHDVWDAVDMTDGTPGNSNEMLIEVFPRATPNTPRLLPDITNLNITPTEKTRPRQTYAAKGVDRSSAYARSFGISFDHEVVRKDDGTFIDNLQELLEAGRSLGPDNRRRFRIYDALGADEAIDGVFNVSYPARSGVGWDEAAYKTITLTQYSDVEFIPNPVLVGRVPLLTSVLPTGKGAGATVYIEGSNLARVVESTASNVQFGGVNATSFKVISDTLIIAVIPAGAAGTVDVSVHNPDGTSTIPYVRSATGA